LISKTTTKFWDTFEKLPKKIKIRAEKAYKLFSDDERHPSLRFKKIHSSEPIYSVRITQDYRALGVIEGKIIIWFWIGSHADYELLLKKF
tara:strand:- start:12641 stop:12910 length:270 start_codon:yes stop_codon:yes gene_type:complete